MCVKILSRSGGIWQYEGQKPVFEEKHGLAVNKWLRNFHQTSYATISRFMTEVLITFCVHTAYVAKLTIYGVIFTRATLRVSAVLAIETWLTGWVAGCLSHAGIVFKRLNLS